MDIYKTIKNEVRKLQLPGANHVEVGTLCFHIRDMEEEIKKPEVLEQSRKKIIECLTNVVKETYGENAILAKGVNGDIHKVKESVASCMQAIVNEDLESIRSSYDLVSSCRNLEAIENREREIMSEESETIKRLTSEYLEVFNSLPNSKLEDVFPDENGNNNSFNKETCRDKIKSQIQTIYNQQKAKLDSAKMLAELKEREERKNLLAQRLAELKFSLNNGLTDPSLEENYYYDNTQQGYENYLVRLDEGEVIEECVQELVKYNKNLESNKKMSSKPSKKMSLKPSKKVSSKVNLNLEENYYYDNTQQDYENYLRTLDSIQLIKEIENISESNSKDIQMSNY